ncbi:MAG: SPASM domain-containing protein [Muribaculaceae bacterium]|nr:SPASM domain-containing protein [Muribaculaceae bacterium]
MELSIYSITFVENGKFYLYNSQTNFFSEISEELYKSLKNRTWQELPESVIEQLISKKIIVNSASKYDYYNLKRLQFNAQKYNTGCLGLVIVPTTACNFACPYCFEPKKDPKTITAPIIDDLQKFIKSFVGAHNIDLTWYGGEPLLAFNQIKDIYRMLTEDGMPEIKAHSIVTNGYLFTEEVIDFFKGKKLGNIQITIDGSKEHHNTTRCLKAGQKPTFDVIINNIELILQHMPETILAIRVNVKKSNLIEYLHLLEYFNKKYPDNKKLNIYPGLIREETPDKKSLTCDCFSSEDVSDLNQLIKEAGYSANIFPKRQHRGCMAQSLNSYIIGPEGELYKCWNDVSNPNMVIGNISSMDTSGSTRLLNFMTESTPFDAKCKICHAFPICDGGCAYYRLRNLKENACFPVCSSFKDIEKLKRALFNGVKPELI